MAAAPQLVVFDDEDLNGACFIAGAEGEPEELINTNVVVFEDGITYALDATAGQPVVFTANQTSRFIYANAGYLIEAGRTTDVAAKVAYIRFIAARNGLISPAFTTAAHNVRYNHATIVTDAEFTRHYDAATTVPDILTAVNGALTGEIRAKIRRHFSDYVCCVAYIFRVRGHHYKDDFLDRYTTLWSRCLKAPDDVVLEWKNLATDALHAIMPDVLDAYWAHAVNNARCAGTLVKRYDSAPAGCAGVYALQRGLEDVVMLFPGIVDRVPDAHAGFKTMMDQLGTSRWGGSVNCRFYGVPRIRVDENRVGALASVVMGVYAQLATDSKLRDSPSLKRLAEIAPATGGAIGMAARRAAADDRFNIIQTTEKFITA